MKKKLLFIILPVITLIIVLFIFGVNTYKSKLKRFQEDGHIIATVDQKTTKYYFEKDDEYKINNSEVRFTDSDNKKLKIPEDTFIHYSDGSISTFKKAVVLNLNDLNTTTYKYYNIFTGSIFTKRDNKYIINYLDKKLTFSNFLIKISENKYMIVGEKITLQIGKEIKEIDNKYIEVSYLDGNIIRLENQELSLQNISSEMFAVINDVKIDLMNKKIYSKDEKKLNMSEITIDSSDNIEISPDDENTTIEEEKKEEEKNETKEEHKLPNVNNGIINTEDDDEEIITDNSKVKDAEFTVTNMEVTANRIRAEVLIKDEEGILTGDLNIKIVENSSNKIVYQTKESGGTSVLQVEQETLKPETTYILIVNSDYEKNGVKYNKDFVQKTFITESIGISINENYLTTNTISLLLEKNNYSDIASVDVQLLDKTDGIIDTVTANLQDINQTEITFVKLYANTEYTVKLLNFIYKDAIINDNFDIKMNVKTLKEKPTFGKTTFAIDKKNGEFNMMLNNVNDPDSGIVSYRYEVYDARTLNTDAGSITTVEKKGNSSATLKVDDKTIERGVPYIFRVVATFNDNEKEYEYVTDYSDIMMLDGVKFPTVRFDQKEVTFERIEGNIVITDEGSAINLNDGSIISVTYTDSVGVSKTITTTGNLSIPISINNLRANETYSFSVYATVNLQDNNPIIDNCYIGSVIVKTELPDSFKLQYSVDEENVSQAFSIRARLASDDGTDTSLEADTLTGVQFNLYKGRNTNTTPYKSITKVDRNLSPYESTLRGEYYDNSFDITPSLFGIKNQDLTSEYYTIEVTGAYDYTTHKNNIDITNNKIIVKTNGYIPDVPEDPTDSIETTVIRNKDANDKYRSDLKAETVVGYKIRAGYDNSRKYATKVIYYLHDAETHKVIETYEYKVPGTGEIQHVDFWLEDGIEFGTTDEKFRRGGKYYFSYEALLDLNFDGTGETIYPTGNTQLTSLPIEPPKQEAVFEFYPSTSSQNKFIWKYKFNDIDKAIYNNEVYYRIDKEELGDTPLTNSASYSTLEIPISKKGNLSIYTKQALINDTEKIEEKVHVYQYYEGAYNPQIGKFKVYLETNRVILSLLDYNTNEAFYDRVAGLKVVFSSDGNKITKTDLNIENGNIIVDLSELEKLIKKNISVSLTLYYDSGIYGYETEGDYFAIQALQVADSSSTFYYTFDNNNQIKPSIKAQGSKFQKTFSIENKKITLKNEFLASAINLPLTIDEKGISYNYEYISPKKLTTKEISAEGTNIFKFDTIIPGISLLNSSGSTNIAPSLTAAKIKAKLFGVSEERIKDNKIYIEVYKTDETASTSEKIATQEFTTADFADTVKVEGLEPQTNYYIKIFADVLTGNEYVYTQLYDVDSQTNNKNYYFKTIGNVGIKNIDISYSAKEYSKRTLKVEYKLTELIGYDKIEYEVYKIIEKENEDPTYELVDLKITPDYIFNSEMTKYIDIPVDCGVEAPNRYQIKIKPYTIVSLEGQDIEVPLEEGIMGYYFSPLYTPYISISSSVYSSKTVTFRINVKDYNKAIVNSEYTVKIFDDANNDVTPDQYKEKTFSISNISNFITLSGVETNEKYTLKVYYNQDVYNNSNRIQQREKSYSTTVWDNEGISVGKVYADVNLEDQTKVNLSFFDSYKLTDITTIRYSIYDNNGYSIDNSIEFKPTLHTTGETSYYQLTLPDIISSNGIYYIAIQFVKDGKIIAEESIEYRYVL